ncbi:MAG: hypothetical protein M9962_06640 [Oligoflexia bacterium]|nr:hypothetical protein [Oligoflexia bacterium]
MKSGIKTWWKFAFIPFVLIFVSAIFLTKGFYDSLDVKSGIVSENKATQIFRTHHVWLEEAQTIGQLNSVLKSLEVNLGIDNLIKGQDDLSRDFNALVAIYKNRDPSSSNENIQKKKSELMEMLVNSYRKEIPHGEIPIRAAYLNTLFDLQTSITLETTEKDLAIAKKGNSRISELKNSTSVKNNGALSLRISNLDVVASSLEKIIEMKYDWEQKKREQLKLIKNKYPSFARNIAASSGVTSQDLRRQFFLATLGLLFSVFLMLAFFYFMPKFLKAKFNANAAALLKRFTELGSKLEIRDRHDLSYLDDDSDWGPIARELVDIEKRFENNFSQIQALFESIDMPIFLYERDKNFVFSKNEKELFGSDLSKDSLDQLLENWQMRLIDENSSEGLKSKILRDYDSTRACSYETYIDNGQETSRYELISYPIEKGLLSGGRFLLVRAIKSEAERIEAGINQSLKLAKELIHKITHGYKLEIDVHQVKSAEIKSLLNDLLEMDRRVSEQNSRRKADSEALIDQIEKQSELLNIISTELGLLSDVRNRVYKESKEVFNFDQAIVSDLSLIRERLDRWESNRDRVCLEFQRYRKIFENIIKFKNEFNVSLSGMNAWLANFKGEEERLKKSIEEINLNATNLCLSSSQSIQESEKQKIYNISKDLKEYQVKVKALREKVSEFLDRVPGEYLDQLIPPEDIQLHLLEVLRQEQENLGEFLDRWNEAGPISVEESKRANDLLMEMKNSIQNVTRLGETTKVISAQAISNLSRWN